MSIVDIIFSFCVGLITYLIHVLFKYNEAKMRYAKEHKGKRKRVNFIGYIENNLSRLIMSLLAYIVLYILVAKVGNLSLDFGGFAVSKPGFLYLFAFLSGYSSDSIFRNVTKVLGKSLDTKLGVSDGKK